MFAASDVMLLNKADLLPYVEFDVQACMAAARRVNPVIEIMPVSARSGEGLAAFADWITARAPG
jgi:hydrogenase nickel incorporation protein HypB